MKQKICAVYRHHEADLVAVLVSSRMVRTKGSESHMYSGKLLFIYLAPKYPLVHGIMLLPR